jgi:transposase-like protein
MRSPFRCFNSSPEIIRLAVLMYPLSLRNAEDLLAERGIDISHETVRFWWNRSARCSPLRFENAGSAHARLSSVALAFG